MGTRDWVRKGRRYHRLPKSVKAKDGAVSRNFRLMTLRDEALRRGRSATKEGPHPPCNSLTTLPSVDSLAARMMLMRFSLAVGILLWSIGLGPGVSIARA